jgi:hypothetical protein
MNNWFIVTLILLAFSILFNFYFIKFKPYGLGDFLRESFVKVKGWLFLPITYIFSGLGMLIISSLADSSYILIDTQLPHLVWEVIRELGIFLFIAGSVGALLHSSEFKQQFSRLLYLNSDYLKNLSRANKKKFFIGTLKSAYRFADYGLEDDFAELTTQNYLPAFEEQYNTNHYINRIYRPINSEDLQQGFRVEESQGWRAHYPKHTDEKMGVGSREMIFKDFSELYQCLKYSNEVWMRKVDKTSKVALKLKEHRSTHIRCGRTEVFFRDDISDEKFTTVCKDFLSIDTHELEKEKQKSIIDEYFTGDKSRFGIVVKVFKKNGEALRIESPDVEIDKRGVITLNYLVGKQLNTVIKIDFQVQTVNFRIGAMLEAKELKCDYHFVQNSNLFNHYGERFVSKCNYPTKNLIVSVLMEGVPAKLSLLTDVHCMAFKSSNAMMNPIKTNHHYSEKFSGWFFRNHGVVFSYRLVKNDFKKKH